MADELPTWDEALASNDTRPTWDETMRLAPNPAAMDPMVGPGVDAYLSRPDNPLTHVLNAFGQGVKQGWGADGLGLSDESMDALKKAGIFPDAEKEQGGLLRAFNEGIIRPLAVGVDSMYRAGSAAFAGAQSAVRQGITELGGSDAMARDIGGLPEAFFGSPGQFHSGAPPEVAAARAAGVIGEGEAGWKGLTEPTAANENVVGRGVEAPEPPAGAGAPGTPQPAAPETPAAPPADIHEAARRIAPDTFNEYDELSAHRDELRVQIGDQQTALRQAAESQAPHAAEIADLQSRMEDTTPRLAKKYQARLDELLPAHDAFLADEFTLGALARDTPEVAAVRQELQQVDYRMRDLAPDVTAAYAEAAKDFPAVEEPAAEPVQAATAPVEPVPEPEPAAQSTPMAPESTPEPAAAPVEAAKAAAPPAVADIAGDVAQKLVAAGRPAEEAEASAALIAAHYEARAARFEGAKGTAQELYSAEAPDIRAGASTRARAPEFASSTRGKIKLMDSGRAVLTLMKDANASTFLHETGHAWLEELLNDAKDEKAPADLTADAATVRKWLGADEGARIATRQHEKFARGFERYMMEGVAPSSRLASVFAKFKGWLTGIYQTVAKLRAPITDDIRDVFDRMLSTPEERGTTIAAEPAEAAQRDLLGHASVPKPETPYSKTPKEPERLANFLKRMGGVQDFSGDVRYSLDKPKFRPGLINKNGMTLERAAERAGEGGYFPELGEEKPTINQLLDKLDGDLKYEPAYSHHDEAAVAAFKEANAHNAEIDRLSFDHGIDPKGMTREQFYDAVTEKLNGPKLDAEMESIEDSFDHDFDTAYSEAKEWTENLGEEWNSDEFYGISGPRSLEELEDAYGQKNASGPDGQGKPNGAELGTASGSAGNSEVGGGQGGRPAGDAGRDSEAGAEASDASSGSGEPAPKPEPLPPIHVEGEPADFRKPGDAEIEKAANIRLDKINGTEDLNQALRQLAAENGDFMDARYGTVAFRTQLDIRNTRILLRSTAAEMMDAAVKAATGDPAAITDYVTKSQRAAMVFNHLSTLSADWAHAGHELNRVMPGFDQAKDIAGQIQDLTGRTLFQIQQQAALMAKMDTPEQAAKFASDMEKTLGEKAKTWSLSLFINNLISGPITHMAYGIGNTTAAFYRAVPQTIFQAASGAISAAIGEGAAADRVYFREVVPQLYGIFGGARDGVMPAYRALKSGIPELPGGLQSELEIAQNSRRQVIPGKIGYIVEIPSRAVAGIHTFFYSMAYSQEIARLAARDVAAQGLHGNDFNVAVAKLTASPSAEMMDAAVTAGMEGTLMTRPKPGGLQSDLVNFTNKYYLAKLAVPFMQIGTNILHGGLVDKTLVSLMSSEARADIMGTNGGVARDIRRGKIAAGTMLSGAVVGMTANGVLTGGGPVDPKQRRVLEDSGWKAYSLKLGDTYVPYRKYLGPLGPLVAAHADFYEVGHAMEHDGLTKAAAALAFGFAEVVADESWMAGVSNLVSAAHDWDTKGARYLRDLATSFMPMSVGMGQVARMVDPYQRTAHTLLDAVKNKIPFVSESLQPQIGIWGQPIVSHTMTSRSYDTHDPVDARLLSLGMGVTPVERKIRGIPLSDAQYTEYASTAGRTAKQRLDAYIRQPGFDRMPEGMQQKIIGETISKAREDARDRMMMRYPAIMNEARQNKTTLLTTGKPH